MEITELTVAAFTTDRGDPKYIYQLKYVYQLCCVGEGEAVVCSCFEATRLKTLLNKKGNVATVCLDSAAATSYCVEKC